jgi:hypothetical protein
MQLDIRNTWNNHFPAEYQYLLDGVYVFLLLQMEYSLLVQARAVRQLNKADVRAFKKIARGKAIATTANHTQPKDLDEAEEAAAMLVESLRDPQRGFCCEDPGQDAAILANSTPGQLKTYVFVSHPVAIHIHKRTFSTLATRKFLLSQLIQRSSSQPMKFAKTAGAFLCPVSVSLHLAYQSSLPSTLSCPGRTVCPGFSE